MSIVSRALVVGVAFIFASIAAASLARAERVFFGNLHSHTSYRDGGGRPTQAFLHARTKAKFDFLAITEHNHKDIEGGASRDRADGGLIAKKPALYKRPATSPSIRDSTKAMKKGSFVALYGQEFSSINKGKHINVFEITEIIDVAIGDIGELFTNWLRNNLDSLGQPAIVHFNHLSLPINNASEYSRHDFRPDKEWFERVGKHALLSEVLNGPGWKVCPLPPEQEAKRTGNMCSFWHTHTKC
jgi:hypothetical protein